MIGHSYQVICSVVNKCCLHACTRLRPHEYICVTTDLCYGRLSFIVHLYVAHNILLWVVCPPSMCISISQFTCSFSIKVTCTYTSRHARVHVSFTLYNCSRCFWVVCPPSMINICVTINGVTSP